MERRHPLVFGEALFDVFESGESVLGGAPFNVAWNLKGLGLEPLFISRVGDDERGMLVLESMRKWGMSVDGVQIDEDHPTGAVQVSLKNGQPAFSIIPDQAYDFIDPAEAVKSAGKEPPSMLYHGTLISRSERSRKALDELKRAVERPVFVDVNLRPPWWNADVVDGSLRDAAWAKLNCDELLAISRTNPADDDFGKLAMDFRRNRGLECLIVTLGEDGAMFVTEGGVARMAPVNLDSVVDTVGAGDAFSAVAIIGLSLGWPAGVTLERAVAFASDVCQIRGATVFDGEMYERRAREWGLL